MPMAPSKSHARRSSGRSAADIHVARTVGERLRALRKQQQVRLTELAKNSGVDPATISRIETGRMVGTLESHMKLAQALGVKITELYAGLEEARTRGAVTAQTPAGRTEVYVHQAGKSSMAMLTTEVLKKKLMPVLITLEPGGSTHREEAKVGTEQFLYILEGDVEAIVGEQTYKLKRGNTLYLDASLVHHLRNATSKVARCLSVTTPPAL